MPLIHPPAGASGTPTSRLVSAGTGLTGGGDLTADRTIALSAGSVTSLGKADSAAQPLTPSVVSTSTTGTLVVGVVNRIDTTSAGTYSRTLPAASSVASGGSLTVKITAGANPLTLNRAGADTINITATSRVVTIPEVAVTLVTDGVSNWSVVATDTPASQLSSTYVPVPALAAPASPALGQLWKSSSPKHLKWPAGPGGRYPLPISGVEMSGWTDAAGVAHIYYTNNSTTTIYHSQCAAGADPTVSANWSSGTVVLGGGTGGQASTANRSGVYVEGSTIYLYYQTGATVRVATATTSAPTVFTDVGLVLADQSSGRGMGNTVVLKVGATYYLFFEYLALPQAGKSGSAWETGLATSTSPTTGFAVQVQQYLTLIPSLRIPAETFNSTTPRQNTASGSWVGLDADGVTFVAYYHSSPGWDGTTLIYRATIPVASAGSDAWTIDNAGYPAAWPVTQAEQMQIGDPFLFQIGGTWYGLWEGGGSGSGGGSTTAYIAPLGSRELRWDGRRWSATESPDNAALPQAMFSPPALIVPPGHESGASSNTLAWPAVNRMIGARFQVLQPGYYRYVNWNCVTQSGNIDVGIVKLSGTGRLTFSRIASLGITACPAGSNNNVRSDLGAGVYLEPGDYALSLWADNTTFVLTAIASRTDLQASRRSFSLSSQASGIPLSGTFTPTNVALPLSLEIED